MAFAATVLGSVWHAVWAGIPLGLCVIAFTPGTWFQKMGEDWGIREQKGDPATKEDDFAWIDESNYYFIKVTNEPELDSDLQRRTLVLDNLIHGYFMLGHPERLDYDYEHIYALVAYRAAKASGKITLAPDGPPTRPATGGRQGLATAARERLRRRRQEVARRRRRSQPAKPEDKARREPSAKAEDDDDEKPRPCLPKVEKSSLKTLFLGGGAYTFQRHMQYAYPGTEVDVAEIDPAVTNANFKATGLPRDTPIKTYWGDARQFVERNQDSKQYDLIFGDAFNDFSVPWHLTTREFNEKITKMMSPTGVYMINIIDVYESDAMAGKKAEKIISSKSDHRSGPSRSGSAPQELDRAHRLRRVPRRLGQDRQADVPPHLHLRDRSQSRARDSARPSSWSHRSSRSISRTWPGATTTPSSTTTAASPSRPPTAPRTRRPSSSAVPATSS